MPASPANPLSTAATSPILVILNPSDKVRCLDSGGLYRRWVKDLNVKKIAGELSRELQKVN
jgi:hypothetical protein